MRNNNFIDFGEEVSRTVRKVLNNQDLYDLKNTINRTMNNVPGMGGSPFFQDPFSDGLPPLSKEYQNQHETNNYKQVNPRNIGNSGVRDFRIQKGSNPVASILLLVFGSIGAVCTGVITLLGLAVSIYQKDVLEGIAVTLIFGVPFAISLFMIILGSKFKKRSQRFRLYQNVLNGRTFCTIQELSTAARQDNKFTIDDLRKMIRAGLFKEGYLDEQETCLITDFKTYIQYLETMKSAREKQESETRVKEETQTQREDNPLQQTIAEGKNYIKTIKEANDALPEEEISEKLDQLESVTTKIFDYVEQHPEKLPEIRKFMCYYMPITLKLVKAYQQFDEHGFNEGEIADTKKEIKGTLNTINMAYQNLLKKLMQTDILDVSSDISALETILAQEGLTDDDFITNKGLN
ncbi:MAG: 5-bromo-4-chloroindolyl phosphate hydrolysis family protein [Aminipila sp.]